MGGCATCTKKNSFFVQKVETQKNAKKLLTTSKAYAIIISSDTSDKKSNKREVKKMNEVQIGCIVIMILCVVVGIAWAIGCDIYEVNKFYKRGKK